MSRKQLGCAGFVALFLLAALLGACMPGSTPAPLPTPTFWPTAVVPEKPTYTVERGTVVDSLTYTGRVAPVEEAELYFRTDGRVLDVYVERGDTVAAGERLAELDVAALYRQLAQAELALETAQTDLVSAEAELAYRLARARLDLEQEQIALRKIENHDPSTDVAVEEAELETATLELHAAQANYDRVADSPNIMMLPEADALHRATLAHARAKAAYDRAVKQSVQESAQRAYDIESQQKRVEISRLEVENLKAGVDPRLEQAIREAGLGLADLQEQITDTLILAPFEGEVTAISTSAGRAVEGFNPVLILADPSDLEVRAELSADDMQGLSEGQAATVVPVEYPGEERPATIRSLPYPYGSGGGTTELEDRDRFTHLSADMTGLEVEPGDLVRVTVVLDKKEDALWLPPAAIRTFEGRKFVVVQEGQGQRQVDVTLGIESKDRIEIVDGLEQDQVVVGP